MAKNHQAGIRKTVGGASADMLTHFSVREPAVFTNQEAAEFLGSEKAATNKVLSRLVDQGWISRLRRGVYEIAPAWSQPGAAYVPDRYAALAQWLRPPYYVGFRSAFEIHNALLQPVVGRVYVVVPQQREPLKSATERIVWVTFRGDRFSWGIAKQWFGARSLLVSDWERTILDSLHLPRLAGGISEVASILARNPQRLNFERLSDYAMRYSIGTVKRRLGWVLERVEPKTAETVTASLSSGLPPLRGNPPLLDPTLPSGGPIDRKWGLRINTSPEDLISALTT